MCTNLFKAPSIPTPPVVAPVAPPEAPVAPEPEPLKNADERLQAARSDTRKRAAALAALSGTTLTSPLGLSSIASTTKTQLGQ